MFLETGATLNCVNIDSHSKRCPKIQSGTLTTVYGASKNPFSTRGVIYIYSKIGNTVVKSDILVCQSLSVPFILKVAYIDKFVKLIHVEYQKLNIMLQNRFF